MGDGMIRDEDQGVPVFRYPIFTRFPELRHGIFTRHGGYSKGAYASLNISYGLGDEYLAVRKNRDVVKRIIGAEQVLYVNQNHGTNILIFRKEDESGTPIASPFSLSGDAMITNIPGRFLAVQVADCQVVFLYDPQKQVVANIHAGWRGTINNIAGLTVGKMKTIFGCLPQNLYAAVGPSLGPCCAEYRNYRQHIPERFWKYKDSSHRFDFWAITADQLVCSGLLKEHISISYMCTECMSELFYSYRAQGTTGRFAAVIGLG